MSIEARNSIERGIDPQVDRKNYQSASTATMRTVPSENEILHTIASSMIAIKPLTIEALQQKHRHQQQKSVDSRLFYVYEKKYSGP